MIPACVKLAKQCSEETKGRVFYIKDDLTTQDNQMLYLILRQKTKIAINNVIRCCFPNVMATSLHERAILEMRIALNMYE